MIGSSPRAWGIRLLAGDAYGQYRFIPTCVGNTESGQHIPEEVRFIPTCVGNTSTASAASKSSSVHPHVRGEYLRMVCSSRIPVGSSPRAWGIHVSTARYRLSGRFIPTCVGNTVISFQVSNKTAVHPHVRGEYGLPCWQNQYAAPVHPHVRGEY